MHHATTFAQRLSLTLILAALLGAACVTTAPGAPSAAEVAADRQALERAIAKQRAGRFRADRVAEQVRVVNEQLDEAVAAQDAAQARLRSHANTSYRSGQSSFIELLLGAIDFADFSSRWAMLTRINEDEARTVQELKAARREAKSSATKLLALQQTQARELRALARTAAAARTELAGSQAAYQEYQRRTAAQKPDLSRHRGPGVPPPSVPQVAGNGAWGTGVASHYGRNFTGRGASGKRIGPDSMMVAHKTLPFGTLVEFRYNGRTAVASVEDRGPFTPGRDWDLGPGVIRVLGFNGVHKVQYRVIGR